MKMVKHQKIALDNGSLKMCTKGIGTLMNPSLTRWLRILRTITIITLMKQLRSRECMKHRFIAQIRLNNTGPSGLPERMT